MAASSGGSVAPAATELQEFWRTRFYQNKLPAKGEVVVVRIRNVAPCGTGIYVRMLEYGGFHAFLHIGEWSVRPVTADAPTTSKLVRVGRMMLCKVLVVDELKGNTDLSKKSVSAEEAAEKEQAFSRAKFVHSLMWHAAQKSGIPFEEMCQKVSWPLFSKNRDVYGLMKQHVLQQGGDLWDQVDFSQPGLDLSSKAAELQADVETCLRKRLFQRRQRLRAKVEVFCPEEDGVERVQEALRCGAQANVPECELSIRLVASPVYAIQCSCLDRDAGVTAIDAAMSRIEASILESGGSFRLRLHPERPDEELVSCADSEEYELEEGGEATGS